MTQTEKKLVEKLEAYIEYLKTKPRKDNIAHSGYKLQILTLKQQIAEEVVTDADIKTWAEKDYQKTAYNSYQHAFINGAKAMRNGNIKTSKINNMKTEQKMTRAELIKSNEYWQETIENLLYSYDRMEISTNHFKEEILRIRDEYAQQRVREELIKYEEYCDSFFPEIPSDFKIRNSLIEKYLKQREK